MTKTKQTIQKKYNLNNSYTLSSIDYRDKIENDEIIEDIIQTGNINKLLEDSLDWISDCQFESINYIIKELQEKTNKPIPDKDKEAITDYLYAVDDSDVIKELLNNTPSKYFYYSLGINFGEPNYNKNTINERIKTIAQRLRIKAKKHYKILEEIVINASYGGELVMLFEDEINRMLWTGDIIEFMAPAHIAIIDRFNGSGWYAKIDTKIICEFNRLNLHSDEGAPGYSFTGDVCGLTKGFMGYSFIRKSKPSDKIIKSIINEEEQKKLEYEKKLQEKWDKTKQCTFGDMQLTRHAQTEYINNFPCGNKCLKCGTFWID